jgi:phosphatidylserine/phosphatidylglycerophosphate/cardiolipin synthase-like enzyme
MQPGDGPVQASLHSKVWIIGDDLIVGSANADVRSYMMDANNAVMIRHAPDMLASLNARRSGYGEGPFRILRINDT